MIVRILSNGKSFSGAAAYLTHDPNAKTSERVGWTHTLHLANDHVNSAVDEMVWTARNAELLKQEAGIRAGGRETENTVKHLSLNWSPEDNPSREHMIETTEGFLRHMKWDEHQAVLVAHEDKSYAHVHVLLNMIHPETGLRLDDNFERRRAQEWALEYERENNRIYCEQRLKNPAERADALTRDAWMAFQENQKSFERDEKSRLENHQNDADGENNSKIANYAEWKILKEMQQRERLDFFTEGKSAFSELRSSIYREVRDEFRDRWREYYFEQKNSTDDDALAAIKAQLIADQKAVLSARRDDACNELRETRDGLYRSLLDGQQEVRAELRTRQEAGFDNMPYLHTIESRTSANDAASEFREAAEATTARTANDERTEDAGSFSDWGQGAFDGGGSAANLGGSVSVGLGFGFLSLVDVFMKTMEGSRPESRPQPVARNPFAAAAAEEAAKLPERHMVEREREEERRAFYGE